MSKSYLKPCIYCKEEIEMSDKEGKWLPYNKTGTPHDCRKEKESQSPANMEGRKKITTIDGIAALEMIQNLERGNGFYFQQGEHKGAKILEVYIDE